MCSRASNPLAMHRHQANKSIRDISNHQIYKIAIFDHLFLKKNSKVPFLADHIIVPAEHFIVPAEHFIVPAEHFIVPAEHFIVLAKTLLSRLKTILSIFMYISSLKRKFLFLKSLKTRK